MMRAAAVSIALFAACAAPASAHDAYRVAGVLTSAERGVLEVEMKNGETAFVFLLPDAVITRDGDTLKPEDLAVGDSVIVDAEGHGYFDLEGWNVRVVPVQDQGAAARP